MSENDFFWLVKWYSDQCDGDWEHGNGIHIDTIDNPGWSIKISLEDTTLEKKRFNEIKTDNTETNWIFCSIKNNKFEGHCGPLNLPEVLKIFREWAES